MVEVHDNYVNKLRTYKIHIEEQNSEVRTIKYFVICTLLVGLVSASNTFMKKSYIISLLILIITISIIIYLVIKYIKVLNNRKYSIALKEINEKALKRLNGEWKDFDDDGSEYKDTRHSYSNDLDMFGKGSLFQWVNCSRTFIGREILKNRLLHPLNSASEIVMNQQAVQELAANVDWRQQFEAEAMVISDERIDPKNLYKWAKKRKELYTKAWLIFFVNMLPVLTIVLILLAYFTSLIDIKLPCSLVVLQLAILFIGAKDRRDTFNSIYKYKNSINSYIKLLTLINDKVFSSDYLKLLKDNLIINKEKNAVESILMLSKLYDRISNRENMFFMIFNILLLWDYQCMIAFESWRNSSGEYIEKWFNVIGEFDALNSIANISYENPQWTVPKISNEEFILRSKGLGHPLLSGNRVCNNITINGDKNILLITGSNMSGKSTFLRTIGINLILTYIGSVVCANSLECSMMKVMTCMRTSDNLENSISSFYAEILRIKMIVEEARRDKKVFFLLDEVFKGTNSVDRHAGAIALIKQLGKYEASGLVSTHDLELCDLQNEYSKIENYHFQEYYLDNQIKFDYKIRKGVSNTRNALYLMKLAGIELK